MSKLPTEIQVEFFKLLNNEVTIEHFEQWVYKTKVLETYFGQTDYLEFISLNFKDRHVIHDMKKIVDKYLDFGEFEKRKLQMLLNDLINKNDSFAKSLIASYDLYCSGYNFFDNLGLGYGLTFANDFYEFKDWEKLSSTDKDKRINDIYEGVKNEAIKILSWLDTKKIVLAGEIDEIGRYDFVDNRTAQEKLTGYSAIHSEEIKSTTYNSTLPKAGQKWWQKLFSN